MSAKSHSALQSQGNKTFLRSSKIYPLLSIILSSPWTLWTLFPACTHPFYLLQPLQCKSGPNSQEPSDCHEKLSYLVVLKIEDLFEECWWVVVFIVFLVLSIEFFLFVSRVSHIAKEEWQGLVITTSTAWGERKGIHVT